MTNNVSLALTRETLDQGRAFQLYCLLGGNAERTALMCRCAPEVIESLAHDFNWKMGVRTDLSKDGALDEYRKLNRAAALMIAEKARAVIEGLIDRMSEPKALENMVIRVVPGTDGQEMTFEPKAVESVIKSLDTVQQIMYRALGDTEAAGTDSAPKGNVADPLGLYKRLSERFVPGHDGALASAKAVIDVTPAKSK